MNPLTHFECMSSVRVVRLVIFCVSNKKLKKGMTYDEIGLERNYILLHFFNFFKYPL